MSARAITHPTIRKLVEHNRKDEYKQLDSDPPSQKRKASKWQAGHRLRAQLNLMYILMFLCLLRYDEVLHIEWRMVEVEEDPQRPGRSILRLQLPFRKTHQRGG